MIRLNSSTTLQALLVDNTTTNTLNAVVNYSDKTATDYPGGYQVTSLSTNASAHDICSAPASGNTRDIDTLSINNRDTVPATVTLRYSVANADLVKITLQIGEMLQYTHGEGFRVLTVDGVVKTGSVQDLSGYQLISGKNDVDGYVGLLGRSIVIKDSSGAVASAIDSLATVGRGYHMPDKSGTVAMVSDVVTDHTALSNIGTNTHAQIDTHIASTANPHAVTKTQVGLGNVDNTSDVNKPVSTAQANADAAVLSTAQSYADGLVVGLLDDRGNFDASGNAWPTTGGSGAAGAIKKGDLWTISVAGTLGGHAVTAGDVIRALADTPGSTDANWAIAENNFGYVAENSANKNASGGYAGLTLFKLNLVNALGTVTSWFTTAATVARTWTMPDKDGTVAMTSDITGTNSGTNTGDQTITLTGDVTGSGTGSFATTIANAAVTLAKMANMATASVFYRKTAGSGAPEVQTLATLKTDLGLTGTNSGDQTITLTGGVTGSGTGSFAATVVTNANLTGDVTSVGNSTTLASTAVTPGSYTSTNLTVDAKGRITAASNGSGGSIAPLVVEDANNVAQRNGTTAQSNHIYNTFTDASNYERFSISWASNILTIGPKILGSGSNRVVKYSLYSNANAGRIASDPSNFGVIISGNAADQFWFADGALRIAQTVPITWTGGSSGVAGATAGIAQNAAGVIEVNTGTAGTYADIIARRHITAPSSTNGQSLGLKCLTELTTIAAAATTDTAIQMPANSIVLAVSVRVTTAITCTSTFTVGDSGSATRFGSGLSKAVNTTNAGTVAPYVNASALSVRITPDTTPSDATGRVRVTIYYFEATVPTS